MIKINDILKGSISFTASGSAYLVSIDLPKDIYIDKNNTNKALHLDTVNIKVISGNGRLLEGEVIEVLERFRTDFVGTIQVSKRYSFFIPDSRKLPLDFYIPNSKVFGAKDGQKVVVRFTEWKDEARTPNGEVIKVIGNFGEHETEIHSILEEHGLPYNFPDDVIAESEAILSEIPQDEIDKRRDMRNIPTFTIDPIDSRDADDALSVEWVNGELFVGIHIADVSHYMRPDTELDSEAFQRGTSVYLVDRVVPMLPERLSNGVCSLRPNEDKLCFSTVFKMDKNGVVLDEWFGRTIINSNNRLSYEEAQTIIESPLVHTDKSKIYSKIFDGIKYLDKLAKKMRKKRLSKGAISFDKQEIRFRLGEDSKPIGIVFKVSKDSNKLIEEFMLLANRKVAEYINSRKLPMVNRAHDTPNIEKLENLKTFISQFGYVIDTLDPIKISKTLNQLLIDVKGTAEEDIVSNLVVRTMQKATYQTKNIGHYGLGFKDYGHFTSPIRRYPDVMVHRLLAIYLTGASKTTPNLKRLEGRCQYLSEREKKAGKAERDSIKYMQCVYLEDKIGKVYTGIVSSVADYGLFVTINENSCNGLVRLSDISGDTYVADTKNYCVKGYNTGSIIRVGDKITIVVKSVNIEEKNIDLKLLKL